jgi:type II secretory pathway pseudopilin PulG
MDARLLEVVEQIVSRQIRIQELERQIETLRGQLDAYQRTAGTPPRPPIQLEVLR